MALDKDRLADAWVDGVASTYGFTWTAPQRAQARPFYLMLATELIKEIKTNGRLSLLAGDISVPAAGLTISGGGGGTVAGTAQIAAATLTGKMD